MRSLPAWFGNEAALQDYVTGSVTINTFTARHGDTPTGILALTHPDPATAEIHLTAVAAAWRNQGVGTLLLKAAQSHLAETPAKTLQVKTLSPQNPDPNYAATRAFYTARGFTPMAELPHEWAPEHPCLLMSKPLNN